MMADEFYLIAVQYKLLFLISCISVRFMCKLREFEVKFRI